MPHRRRRSDNRPSHRGDTAPRPRRPPVPCPGTHRRRDRGTPAGVFPGRRLAPGNRCRPQVAACRPEGPLAPAHGRGGRSARRRAAPAASAGTDDRAASAAVSARTWAFRSAAGSNRGSRFNGDHPASGFNGPVATNDLRRRIPDEPVLDDLGAAGQHRRRRFRLRRPHRRRLRHRLALDTSTTGWKIASTAPTARLTA